MNFSDLLAILKQRGISFVLLLFSTFAFAAACNYGPISGTPVPAIGVAVVMMGIFCHFTRGLPAANFTRVALLAILVLYIGGTFFV